MQIFCTIGKIMLFLKSKLLYYCGGIVLKYIECMINFRYFDFHLIKMTKKEYYFCF